MIYLRQRRKMKSRELPDFVSAAHSIQLLLKHQGVVLTRDNQLVDFITRHDVINLTDGQ